MSLGTSFPTWNDVPSGLREEPQLPLIRGDWVSVEPRGWTYVMQHALPVLVTRNTLLPR
jgi:hypothetical protein